MDAIVGRITAEHRLTTYDKLVDGTLTLYDVFSMVRLADWLDYKAQWLHNATSE